MRNNSYSNKYLKEISKNWPSQTKIDALQLQGIIDKETCIKTGSMRNRRNNLFHVSKEENKRKIVDFEGYLNSYEKLMKKYQKTLLI